MMLSSGYLLIIPGRLETIILPRNKGGPRRILGLQTRVGTWSEIYVIKIILPSKMALVVSTLNALSGAVYYQF